MQIYACVSVGCPGGLYVRVTCMSQSSALFRDASLMANENKGDDELRVPVCYLLRKILARRVAIPGMLSFLCFLLIFSCATSKIAISVMWKIAESICMDNKLCNARGAYGIYTVEVSTARFGYLEYNG